jgi:hypothetical protein
VRTINAVQAAGLKVYGVEITLSGSIKISTATPSVKEAPARQRKPAQIFGMRFSQARNGRNAADCSHCWTI